MINYEGIVKPAFHAYHFLSALGDERIAQAPGAVITRHKKDGRITVAVALSPANEAFRAQCRHITGQGRRDPAHRQSRPGSISDSAV